MVDACETRLLVLEDGQRLSYVHRRYQRYSHLTIRQPKDGQPEEHLTGLDATSNFVHPRVIESHPYWLVGDFAWFCSVPDIRIREVLPRTHGIEREAPFQNQPIRSHGLDQHITLWGFLDVVLAEGDHQKRAKRKEDSW